MSKNILICSDKFKGSLGATEVCKSIEKGILLSETSVTCVLHPMADGGDGSLSVINSIFETKHIAVETFDSIGRPQEAFYLIQNNTAFIELAIASGLAGLTIQEQNPLRTSTYGTGLLIKDAISKNVDEIVMFLGGSSTNDAGLGIAKALGYTFLDRDGLDVEPTGGVLSKITTIIPPNYIPQCSIRLLCDVDNPFHGSNGAAHVFSKQKGATPDQVAILDSGLKHLNNIFIDKYTVDLNLISGSGSAGGVAGGLHILFGASIESGFDVLSQLSKLEEKIKSADLVITGEGQLDHQSLQGKVVGKIAALCLKYNRRLITVVGNNTLLEDEHIKSGIEKVYAIKEITSDTSEAMTNAATFIEQLACAAMDSD